MKPVNGVTAKVEACEGCGNPNCSTTFIRVNTPHGEFTLVYSPKLMGVGVVKTLGVISKDTSSVSLFVNVIGLVESLAQAHEEDEIPESIEEFLKGLK